MKRNLQINFAQSVLRRKKSCYANTTFFHIFLVLMCLQDAVKVFQTPLHISVAGEKKKVHLDKQAVKKVS